MPYKREGSIKITNHTIQTPLADITASCKTCHMQNENELKNRVSFIQNRHAYELRGCENALLSLIKDISYARGELAKLDEFAALSADEQKAKISEVLAEPLKFHRKAHLRWDFAFSENSYGFHAPQEAMRITGQCKENSRLGQIALVNVMSKYGIKMQISETAEIPEAPEVITEHKYPVASKPSDELLKLDEDIKNLKF